MGDVGAAVKRVGTADLTASDSKTAKPQLAMVVAMSRCEKATERLQRSATASRSWDRVLKSQLTRGFFTA
jgi:hypothetical protein